MKRNGSAVSNNKKWFRIFFSAIVVVVIFALLLLRIWLLSDAVQLACDIDTLKTEQELLEEENKNIQIEIAKLKSPERISKVAVNELGMVRSSGTKVVVIRGDR